MIEPQHSLISILLDEVEQSMSNKSINHQIHEAISMINHDDDGWWIWYFCTTWNEKGDQFNNAIYALNELQNKYEKEIYPVIYGHHNNTNWCFK